MRCVCCLELRVECPGRKASRVLLTWGGGAMVAGGGVAGTER